MWESSQPSLQESKVVSDTLWYKTKTKSSSAPNGQSDYEGKKMCIYLNQAIKMATRDNYVSGKFSTTWARLDVMTEKAHVCTCAEVIALRGCTSRAIGVDGDMSAHCHS